MTAPVSLARVLEAAMAGGAAAAFSPGAMGRLLGTAGLLPGALGRRVYFESRLTGSGEQVDLSVHVDRSRRAILTGRDPHAALARDVTRRPLWRHVDAFATAWAEPGGRLDRDVAGAWLEFDLDPLGPGGATPGVFVDFTHAALTGGSAGGRARLAAAAAAALLRGGVDARTRGALERAFAALPRGATVPYVGVLPSRAAGAVRLCVDGLGDADVARYLRAVRWPGAADAAVDLVRALTPSVDAPGGGPDGAPRRTLLHVDVGAETGPRLGIEFVLGRRRQIRGAIGEQRFLGALVATGLCTAAARDALLAWPHCRFAQLPHELWPTLVVRRVNHVKLTVHAEASVEAKAYRCLEYGYVSRTRGARRPAAA